MIRRTFLKFISYIPLCSIIPVQNSHIYTLYCDKTIDCFNPDVITNKICAVVQIENDEYWVPIFESYNNISSNISKTIEVTRVNAKYCVTFVVKPTNEKLTNYYGILCVGYNSKGKIRNLLSQLSKKYKIV